MTESPADEGYLTVARVLRSRGNRGEVAAEDLSGGGERFVPGFGLSLLAPSGERREVVLENAWAHKGQLILKFEGVDSIGEADALRGCRVQVSREEWGPPPEGEHYFTDLIGCRVIDEASAQTIGQVRSVMENTGTPVLEVQSDGREILIPFAESICIEIAPQRREIRVRLPEGLEDLNP